ncbi:replicative DNA helicase [Variovorax boronicumulans]|uniref:replicative DNA helicase n=1 Tax=Variovorax boronicumulans TaxID=436515 RepID=UPI00277FA37D|nr:replicative DNA helicase [Variovorax boronicumulans]MDP9991995.1 replicative DNA helicase [Variovorax boronicumulans]MDQ0001890.1 replicative DNA helicase [Variovorax boronicumulans]
MHPRELERDAIPWSSEAETGVLGALLMGNGHWDVVGDMLVEEQFFDQRHRRVFVAISALINACKPADVVTVFDHLKVAGIAEGIDLSMLHDMAQFQAGSSTVRRYAEIVSERAMLRSLLKAADEVKEIASTSGMPVADRLEKAQDTLQALQVRRGRSEPVVVGDITARMVDRVSDLNSGNVQPGIPTGISSIDKRLSGGLRPGKQIVLAARPSIGKSSLALQIAINLAKAGHGAAFLSQEMPNDEQAERVTANLGQILLGNLMTGDLRDDEWARLTEAVEEMRGLPLFFDDQPALTLQDISAKARALVRRHSIKLLVVDYIQLCSTTSKSGNDKRHHAIEEISRGLKTLAKQLGITILTLSQLGRAAESRSGGKPVLSDLKESGAIEEDADIVILLSIDDIPSQGPKVIEADIAKNRQGRIGSVALAFDGGYQRWQATNAPLGQRKRGARTFTEDV